MPSTSVPSGLPTPATVVEKVAWPASTSEIEIDPEDITYFIGHESIVAGKVPGMHPLLEHLFVLLNRGADSAVRFFNLPPEQVFEVGSRVEI